MSSQSQLNKIVQNIRTCRFCRLAKTRLNAVPGEGAYNAKIMFIGEAPGREEDKCGRPFVGPSGKYLNKLFDQAEIKRKNVYITSIIKCRPPKNRKPKKDEIKACLPWLEKQIGLIKPGLIILLGDTALKSIIGKGRVSQLHGRFIEYKSRIYFITFHPASARRFPKIDKLMKNDFMILKSKLK